MCHRDMLFSASPKLKEPSTKVCRHCYLQQSNMVLATHRGRFISTAFPFFTNVSG